MKIAVLTITYREAPLLKAVLKNWRGKVYKHLVLESKKPWHGQELPEDGTKQLVESFPNTEYISLNWVSEAIQRNWGLAYLHDYDYVLIVDADELYTTEEQAKILDRIGKKMPFEDNQWCYRIPRIKTYFKTTEYALNPPDYHEPVVAVDPKKVVFTETRQVTTDFQIPIEGVMMHHLTYLRDDMRLFHKLRQFEHCNMVKERWYEDKWLKWTP
jgi:glycosyltransferase involved in cell wall biosynthesis